MSTACGSSRRPRPENPATLALSCSNTAVDAQVRERPAKSGRRVPARDPDRDAVSAKPARGSADAAAHRQGRQCAARLAAQGDPFEKPSASSDKFTSGGFRVSQSAKQRSRLSARPAVRSYEYAQTQALGGKVNATIRDQYYGTASATPRAVFPTLQRKLNHHLSRLRKDRPGLAVNLDEASAKFSNSPTPTSCSCRR